MKKFIPAIVLAAICSFGSLAPAMAFDDTWDTWDSWSVTDNEWWETDEWGTDDYGYYDRDYDWDIGDDNSLNSWYTGNDYNDWREYDDTGDECWFDGNL